MENLDQNSWRAALQNELNAVVIDVRTDGECAEGMIPAAIQIDFLNQAHFMAEIDKLAKEKAYYIYCRSGNRSGQACMIMDQLGFTKTVNLIGGMLEWDGELAL
jgi:rhodanese-related sulfurtransferase